MASQSLEVLIYQCSFSVLDLMSLRVLLECFSHKIVIPSFTGTLKHFLGLNRTFLKLVPFKSMRQTLKPICVGFSDFSDSWWYNIKKTQQGLCQVDYLYF